MRDLQMVAIGLVVGGFIVGAIMLILRSRENASVDPLMEAHGDIAHFDNGEAVDPTWGGR